MENHSEIYIYVYAHFILGINIAGVKWVIRLQLLLLIALFLSAMDLIVGSFVHTNPGIVYILRYMSTFV